MAILLTPTPEGERLQLTCALTHLCFPPSAHRQRQGYALARDKGGWFFLDWDGVDVLRGRRAGSNTTIGPVRCFIRANRANGGGSNEMVAPADDGPSGRNAMVDGGRNERRCLLVASSALLQALRRP